MTNGKKVRKDEQNSSDTFDPITLALHQAESALLMLGSPEDDVKIRAAEAIYRFALKSEENKKFMLGQNVCDTLIPLIKSEDKVVKRNAIMILGVLTELPNARTILIKRVGFVAVLIKILQQDEFETTKEFALMTLAHLCLDFQGINIILEKKGLGPVGECLKHADPDIQKNALDVICATLQDFEARSLLKSGDILSSLLQLLNSEFPVIQNLVLQIFSRAAQDSGIRTALREMDVLNHFVNILGNSQLNDLHVPALFVVSSLLEDMECAKSLINNGGLKLLLHFITDRSVFREEELRPSSAAWSVQDKTGKGKKTQDRRSAKKNKGDITAKTAEERPTSNTLPEAKIQACRAVMQASRKEEIRKIMHDAEVERMLVNLLSHDDESVRSAAAQTIAVLAESSICQNSISELGGLELLIRMTRSVHKLPKSAGITALAALTNQNGAICREVANRNSGTEALVSCLQVNDPEIEAIAAGGLTAITNLALEEATRTKILQAVSSKLLVPLLDSNSALVQTKAALAVAAVVCNSKSVRQFCRLGGAANLIKLVGSPVPDVRRAACWAICSIGAHKEGATELAQIGGIQILQEINASVSKRNGFSELALLRVLDANLEAKFVLTGYLDFADNIGDLFFDPGQLLSASEILNLNDYLKQPLNDKRPVYLINVHDPRDRETDQSSDHPSSSITSERDGSENFSNPQLDVVPVPVDDVLKSWLENVIMNILPVSQPICQAEQLGKFVSSCYGGPACKEDGNAMNNQLELAEIKCSLCSNVIPLGCVRNGSQFLRALLFKFFADRIGLPANLVRGNYGRSYNEILIDSGKKASKPMMITYVVDLMTSPGALMESSCSQAKEYISILSS